MSQNKQDVTLGKFLSLILRHNPDVIGIKLDKNGWADVKELLDGIKQSGRHLTMERLERIVQENNKNRYSFNENKTKIRANQGHSFAVDLELEQATPPQWLYHGTASTSASMFTYQQMWIQQCKWGEGMVYL